MNLKRSAFQAMAALCGLALALGYLAPLLTPLSPDELVVAGVLAICTSLSMYRLWQMPQFPLRAWGVLSVIVAALLVTWSVPLAKTNYPQLSVTATGQKNAMSGASEVFVRLVSDQVLGSRMFAGEGWEKRDDVFVSYRDQPKTLHYHGAWSPGATLRLVRHPFSGIAEVRIGEMVQVIDLFATQQEYIDLLLPSPQTSWKSYLQRASIGLAFVLISLTLFFCMAARGPFWESIFIAALLAGSIALFGLSDRSYPGPLEVVSFYGSTNPAMIEMDAGDGFTSDLVVQVKSGMVERHSFTVSDPIQWRLNIDGASLHVLHDVERVLPPSPNKDMDNGCPIAERSRCIYDIRGRVPFRTRLQGQGSAHELKLPADASLAERTFIMVEREPGRITATLSQAYLQLSPWEHFSGWIRSIRVIGKDGKPAQDLFRINSASSAFREFGHGMSEGQYLVPFMQQPATGSFTGMRLFAVLVSIATVLLLACVWKIAVTLHGCYRTGCRAPVVASVGGCLLWLGLATVAGWPAVMGWDGLSPYIQAQAGQVTLWYGIGYPMLIGAFLLLGPAWLISTWSLLATMVLLLSAATLAIRYGSPLARWLAPLLLLLALPFTAVMIGSMTHLRDAMNGLMLALFAITAFSTVLLSKNLKGAERWSIFLILLVAGAVLALLRIDNLPALLILLCGLLAQTFGIRRRAVALLAAVSICWLAVTPMMERIVISDRQGATVEKRLYASTAMINPLTGMLVHGPDRLEPKLLAELSAVLDKVVDVEYAKQHWSPHNVIYWHETSSKREMPSPEIIRQLQTMYIRALIADPILFLHLRLATFASMLGQDWFALPNLTQANHNGHPSFYDHLLASEGNWAHLYQLQGFRKNSHPYPQLTQALLDWSAYWANNFWALLICGAVLARFTRHPLSAVLALAEIARAIVFFFFAPASVFLYLYDLHLVGFILPMLALAEQGLRKAEQEHEKLKEWK